MGDGAGRADVLTAVWERLRECVCGSEWGVDGERGGGVGVCVEASIGRRRVSVVVIGVCVSIMCRSVSLSRAVGVCGWVCVCGCLVCVGHLDYGFVCALRTLSDWH